MQQRLGEIKCRTRLKCDKIRGFNICSKKIRIHKDKVTIYYGKDKDHLNSIELDRKGNPVGPNRDEFLPYAMRESDGIEYFIDYSSLYYVDPMTVYADGIHTALELTEKKYEEGPSIRISPKPDNHKSVFFPVEINFGKKSCQKLN